ncbi:MAG: adenosine kinase [Gammaproteobacteria bacterium]|nr:adenosine kinase [Gammaproteobacteria bacterium]MYF29182.1 adenosine kinase [Gammaproteobacteria bacterium]MYK47967.1 adenosine kinase [Gammaproteobacteria bacterium]
MESRPAHYDVYGLGNALVDLEYTVDDSYLRDMDLDKGHMTLVDETRIDALAERLHDHEPKRRAGGSAANTVFAVHALGGRGAYSCHVADDDLGRFFLEEFGNAGVATAGTRDGDGKSGRCLTLVTADAERTMATFLGASAALGPQDLDEAGIARSAYFYVEGYLASSESGREAAVQARQVAELGRVRTSLSLADPSMVVNFRDGLIDMLGNGIQQLFCNEEEALTWTGTDRLDIAATELSDIAPFVNITLGARGSLAVDKGNSRFAPGFPSQAVDTTGAGDIYAGAVLHARINGAEPSAAARFANFAAAELVARHGARLDNVVDYAQIKASYRTP